MSGIVVMYAKTAAGEPGGNAVIMESRAEVTVGLERLRISAQ